MGDSVFFLEDNNLAHHGLKKLEKKEKDCMKEKKSLYKKETQITSIDIHVVAKLLQAIELYQNTLNKVPA